MDTNVRIVFVLDRTGSMRADPLYSNTISGYNTWLTEMQKELPEATFSLIMFSSFGTTVVHRNARLGDVSELTPTQYVCDGWTPLYEAICKAIEAAEKTAFPDDRVIITILTDGEENCSPKPPYTLEYVAEMVKAKQDAGWQFVFLGANMDAWAASSGTAISQASTMSYDANSLGATTAAYRSAASRSFNFCASGQSVQFDDADLEAAGSDKFAPRPTPGGSGATTSKPVVNQPKPKGTVEIDL